MRAIVFAVSAMAAAVSIGALVACGPDDGRGDDGGGDDSGDDGGCNTRITGVVYAPNGTLPLYGIDVYVPETDPPAPAAGISCVSCEEDLPGGQVVRTVSGVDGGFSLDNVPAGDNVKVVLHVGKWQKIMTVPHVEMCETTELHSSETALPRNTSEGSLPKIAIVTGGFDSLECLARRIGIDDSEFTNSDGAGAVHLFTSNGATTFAATHPAAGTTFKTGHELWGNATLLHSYDAAFFGCEGEPQGIQLEKTQAEFDNVKSYADSGGRVFLSHYHNIWVDGRIGSNGAAPSPPAEWRDIQTCTDPSGTPPTAAIVDTIENPKGPSFFQWMMNVMAINTGGTLTVQEGRQTCVQVDKTKAEQWLFAQGTNRPQMFQFTTPQASPEAQRCGKVVFTDMHVVARPGQTTPVTTPFPDDCATTPLSPQEKALAFMFFDIASCVGEIL